MNRPSVEVIKDDHIAPHVLDILRDAEKQVTLVSPYNEFWARLEKQIETTVRSGVRIDVIYRAGKRSDAIEWLETLRPRVKVYEVENLHAKIYLNESAVLITSMNLLDSSRNNSMEIGISINDDDAQNSVREYVKTLIQQAKEAKKGKKTAASPADSRAKPRKRQTVSESRTKYRTDETEPSLGGFLKGLVAAVTNEGGRCIRCSDSVDFDPDRPLCEDCFKTWNQYGDWDYPEKHCHSCGEKRKTSYAKPLCRPCYDEAVD